MSDMDIKILRTKIVQGELQSTHHADCYRYHPECAIAEVERLRKRERRCQEVCFGAEVEVCRSWVSQEYADKLKAEVERLRERLAGVCRTLRLIGTARERGFGAEYMEGAARAALTQLEATDE